MKAYETHLTYLGKESDELSVRLKARVVIWTQQGMHKNWGIIREFNDIKKTDAIVSGVGGKWLGRKKLVDFKFIRALFCEEPFQNYLSPV